MGSAPLLACERLRSAPLDGAAAAQDPAVIAVLHGVTGSSGQLAPFAQQLIDAAAVAAGRPVEAVLINQRGHGGSRDLPFLPPHTVDACTTDALALLRWVSRWLHTGSPSSKGAAGCWCQQLVSSLQSVLLDSVPAVQATQLSPSMPLTHLLQARAWCAGSPRHPGALPGGQGGAQHACQAGRGGGAAAQAGAPARACSAVLPGTSCPA